MIKSDPREVPARLLRLQERFTAWRKARIHGERIPQPLWQSAAKLAVEYGLNRTATVLRLDYYSLKEHVDQHRTVSQSTNAPFVELPSPSMALTSECVIELEDGTGASMRVHLKGADLPDVLALGRSFWEAE